MPIWKTLFVQKKEESIFNKKKVGDKVELGSKVTSIGIGNTHLFRNPSSY
jgi:hypothetical protein